MIWYLWFLLGVATGLLLGWILFDMIPETERIEQMEENMHSGHHYDK